jgi:predicted patatin/cPLA2 family phospholipase
MPSLVLEGGTFRPIFSAGVMDALLENNIMFPYCIGVSAGVSNGLSYISKQIGRNLEIIQKYRNDKRYLGIGNYFKCKSFFGLDFTFDEIPNKLIPFDMETYLNYSGKFLVGVTNAETGKSEYYDGLKLDSKFTAIRATCALPIFFPAIKLDTSYYYDGGICDPIPIKKAISDGNQKHLIILTRPKSYTKTLSRNNIIASKFIGRKFPLLKEPLLTRHTMYNETVKFCNELEKQGKAIVLRPDEDKAIDSFEKDVNKLKSAYDHGYNLAMEKMNEIKGLF